MESIFGVLVEAAETERELAKKHEGRVARRTAAQCRAETRHAERAERERLAKEEASARTKWAAVAKERCEAAKVACLAKWKDENSDCTRARLFHMASPSVARTRWALFTEIMGATRAQRAHLLKIIGIDVDRLAGDDYIDLGLHAEIMGIYYKTKSNKQIVDAMRRWIQHGPSRRAWASLWEQ